VCVCVCMARFTMLSATDSVRYIGDLLTRNSLLFAASRFFFTLTLSTRINAGDDIASPVTVIGTLARHAWLVTFLLYGGICDVALNTLTSGRNVAGRAKKVATPYSLLLITHNGLR